MFLGQQFKYFTTSLHALQFFFLKNVYTRLNLSAAVPCRVGRDLTEEQSQQKEELLQKIKDRKDNFREMEESLPHKNG